MSRGAAFLVAATCFALGLTGAAAAETYFGFTIGVTNAPPPPRVVYVREPRVVMVPSSTVYVVEDDDGIDMFRVNSAWYAYSRGYWYRAPSYRGPFRVVDVRRVPRAVFGVPRSKWRHHPHGGPPGQMKKKYHGGDDDRDDKHRGSGRGHGKH